MRYDGTFARWTLAAAVLVAPLVVGCGQSSDERRDTTGTTLGSGPTMRNPATGTGGGAPGTTGAPGAAGAGGGPGAPGR